MTEQDNIKVAAWVDGCRKGSRIAQHKLFKFFYNSMCRLCMRYADSTDEADDMLNEGFLKVFSNLDKYENTGSFESWMKRVMINAALDYRRKYAAKVQTVDLDIVQDVDLPHYDENNAVSKLSSDEIVSLIQKLPLASRTVFNLYVFENYSHAEIAKQLNISENTSAWHLNFARTRLKEEIYKLDNGI